jgi:hypothetical protein
MTLDHTALEAVLRTTPRSASQANLNHLAYREGYRKHSGAEAPNGWQMGARDWVMNPTVHAIYDLLPTDIDRSEFNACWIDGCIDGDANRPMLSERELNARLS